MGPVPSFEDHRYLPFSSGHGYLAPGPPRGCRMGYLDQRKKPPPPRLGSSCVPHLPHQVGLFINAYICFWSHEDVLTCSYFPDSLYTILRFSEDQATNRLAVEATQKVVDSLFIQNKNLQLMVGWYIFSLDLVQYHTVPSTSCLSWILHFQTLLYVSTAIDPNLCQDTFAIIC